MALSHPEKLLEQLTCPICSELMEPPVFMCCRGHSICNPCYGKVAKCPTCTGSMLDRECRNFSLESIYNETNLPCRNLESGCTKSVLGEQMGEHMKTCEFTAHACPLKLSKGCEWEGLLKGIELHVRASHDYHFCHEVEILYRRFTKFLSYTEYGFILGYEQVFKYGIKGDGQTVRWSLQHIGLGGQSNNYMLCLKFIDTNHDGQQLVAMSTCQPYGVEDADCFKDDSTCITFNRSQLTKLCKDDDLRYDFYILKRDNFNDYLVSLTSGVTQESVLDEGPSTSKKSRVSPERSASEQADCSTLHSTTPRRNKAKLGK